MKIKNILPCGFDHTWDISTQNEEYLLPNGVISHNTSSQLINSTNGIEPPRALVSVKQSKEGVLKQCVPEIQKLGKKYDLLWKQKSPMGYLKICAVMQKFIDQAISVNQSVNPQFYSDQKVSMKDLLTQMLYHYKMGGKTMYYFNSFDGAGEIEMKEEEDCVACKL
jgi:ribonucleoside-diphosphate reductase alpha chain